MTKEKSRILKKEIKSGLKKLPENLNFFSRYNYHSIITRHIAGKKEWYIEIKVSLFKALIKNKEKLEKHKKEKRIVNEKNKKLIEANTKLQDLAKSLYEENAQLEKANKSLMEKIPNVSEEELHNIIQTSLQKAEKNGVVIIDAPFIEGGLAGVNKK